MPLPDGRTGTANDELAHHALSATIESRSRLAEDKDSFLVTPVINPRGLRDTNDVLEMSSRDQDEV